MYLDGTGEQPTHARPGQGVSLHTFVWDLVCWLAGYRRHPHDNIRLAHDNTHL